MGLSGKVNLNIYDINVKGGATMMVQKVSGGGFEHVKLFGIKVLKFLIDGLIDGSIEEDFMEVYKVKTDQKPDSKEPKKCEKCGKTCQLEQGLRLHSRRRRRGDN